MVEKKYLLEFEDRIEEGAVELLSGFPGRFLCDPLWNSLGINLYHSLFILGLPNHKLVGKLFKGSTQIGVDK